jgi:5-amino-6-(5-phospho-D-ribitylamino)uracil phosphatase
MRIKNETYAAFLFDLDNTLANSHGEITPRTKRALQTLAKKGYRIGLCTGRHRATLQHKALPNLPKESIHVVSGGAQVIDSGGKVHWEKCIPYETAMELTTMLDKEGAEVRLQTDNRLFGNKRARETNAYGKSHSIEHFPHVDAPIIAAENISNTVRKILSQNKQISCKTPLAHTRKSSVDITAAGVSKKSGIIEWCKLHAITPKEIIGFGDGNNDIEFLNTVGYAIAMGNATKEVKQIVDETTGTCDEDGVASWIEQHINPKHLPNSFV